MVRLYGKMGRKDQRRQSIAAQPTKLGSRETGRDSHIAEQILRQHHAVELSRIGDEDHRGRVDELVVELELRVFAFQRLGHDLPPQTGAREHVGLVDRVDRQGRIGREGDLGGDAGDPLDLVDAVDHRVPGDVLPRGDVVLLALAKVDPADELAHDDDVDAGGDRGLEGRVDDQRVGRKVGRADVGVQAEGFAQGEQARLWTHFAVHAPFGSADGTWAEGCFLLFEMGKEEGKEARGRGRKEVFFFWGFYVPISMASASLHDCKVDAGSASPTSSIAHPPKRHFSSLSSTSYDPEKTASRTLTASATTSGPGGMVQ